MDLIKKLTGKNPTEYETVAKSLINNSDKELFAKLVKQEDFLFDFIKDNVAKRIQNACNKENYLNLLNFLEYYSPSYDTMIARVLYSFSGDELLPEMKEFFLNGTDSQKAYAVKYFSFVNNNNLTELLPLLRKTAKATFEPLSINSIEVLSKLQDEVSKNDALNQLESSDEFEQFDGIKFLVNYQAKESLNKIMQVMKTSSLSENIAAEVPYLIPIPELLEQDFESAILVLCNIVNAIPEILSPSVVCDYCLYDIFANIKLTSSSAILLQIAKDKFFELANNDEYIFDCDKNTKDEIKEINNLLKQYNSQKLKSFFYDELYDESDFVFFAIDYVDELEELQELLDSKNETLVLKVLTLLKEKQFLKQEHKEIALKNITNNEIKSIIEVL